MRRTPPQFNDDDRKRGRDLPLVCVHVEWPDGTTVSTTGPASIDFAEKCEALIADARENARGTIP